MTLSIHSLSMTQYALELDKAVQVNVFDNSPRKCWHVCAQTVDGLTGWGDIAPWPGFSETSGEIDAQIHQLEKTVSSSQLKDIDEMEKWLDDLAVAPVIRSGLELACLDLFAQIAGVPIAALLHPKHATELSVHALVDTAETAIKWVESGAASIKVKLSDSWVDDRSRIRDIRRAVPQAKLRLDANGAWTASLAKQRVMELNKLGIDIIEQPVSAGDLAGLRAVASACEMTVSADESVCFDADSVLAIDGLNEIVLKPMYLGGLRPSFELARKAHQRGMRVCVTHALESTIGRTGAGHLAAASDALRPAVHGVSGAWARSDLEITVPQTPGLGVSVQ